MCTITLFKKFKNEVLRLQFDFEDYISIGDKSVTIHELGSNKHKMVYVGGIRFHELVLPVPKGFVVDHINRNSLDNRKVNLRKATRSQNMQNRGADRDSVHSRFKGVTKIKDPKRRKLWVARLYIKKRPVEYAYFSTEKEAALAYNSWALKYHGEFAVLNDVGDE